MKQREYWQDWIIDWEKACYDAAAAKNLPLIERLADNFRGAVRYRRQLGYEIVGQAPRKRVLEFGCGSGAFAIGMVKGNLAEQVVGVDISTAAIQAAEQASRAAGTAERITFLSSDLENLDFKALGNFDYVLGLGLTPYLTDKEFERLFKALGDSPFFFDYHSKGLNYVNMAHAFYRMVKGHPFYRLFTKRELEEMLAGFGLTGLEWGSRNGVDYVCRGPRQSSRTH